jgi:hypothetical protein
MGSSIRYMGPCPNCSFAMFVTNFPAPFEKAKRAVVCHGCGAHWEMQDARCVADAPKCDFSEGVLDEKVELLLQAADAQLSAELNG